ncbi:MAG: electron transfer flavoprotein subunit alpha/FixB family protein [Candidatus Binataceae bacterium]
MTAATETADSTAGEVWAFLETSGSRLHRTATRIAAETARVARLVRQSPCGIAVAASGQSLAAELKNFGLERIYVLDPGRAAQLTPDAYAQAVTSAVLRRKPGLLLFAATAIGNDVAARVATRLRTGFISDCVDFVREGEGLCARKAVYGGDAHMTLRWLCPPPWVATVDAEAVDAIEDPNRPAAQVIEDYVALAPARTELVRRWKVDPRQLALGEASFVVGVGRPVIARARELSRLKQAAESIGAVLGASRPVTEAGLMAKENQIGMSGKWLGADVYIACGISGSAYHMMAVRKVRHLVAVNIDRNAPIFKSAELGIVADLFELLPALSELVKTTA